MNQRTTGIVVSLVIFVILTVGLLASTIYFVSDATGANARAAGAAKSTSEAEQREARVRQAYVTLATFVTGDATSSPESDLSNLKKALNAENVGNLKVEFDSLRAQVEQLNRDNEDLKKQIASARLEAQAAVKSSSKAEEGVEAAKKRLETEVEGYRADTTKYDEQVKETVAAVSKAQDEMEQRHRNEVSTMQVQIDTESSRSAELSANVAELRTAVEQYRVKPENAASLADGRIIDVSGTDGEVFISIGSKQRVQPGMTFDVYDSASAIQYNPTSSELIPGKARIQVLKVDESTSTARVIPEPKRFGSRPPRPIVKDDVIANVIFSPDYRYKFLVHGKFDVDNDGKATAAEAEYVRGRIKAWGGEVVDGDALRADLDFVVLGVKPLAPVGLATDADDGAWAAHLEQQTAFQNYEDVFKAAQTASIPVLNWNRMQVLTNEGR